MFEEGKKEGETPKRDVGQGEGAAEEVKPLREQLEDESRRRVALREKLLALTEEEKRKLSEAYGFKRFEHLEFPEGLITSEGKIEEEKFEEFKKGYLAVVDKEADKMERRKPLPYDTWRILGLFDFLEELPTRVPQDLPGEVKEELVQRLENLGMELKEHLDMREAIWNRICWHEKSLGFLLPIVSEQSPRPTPEQLRAFESLPEIRETLAIFFAEIAPVYAQAHSSSVASVKEFYQIWESSLLEKIPTLGKEGASRIVRKVEDYLKFMGYISMLDPEMKRSINDNLNEAAFGGTRNRKRLDDRKPAGSVYGAGLFIDRVEQAEDRDRMKKPSRNPLILLERERKFEPQYVGSFYHQTTIEGNVLRGRLEEGDFIADREGKLCLVLEREKLVVREGKPTIEKERFGFTLGEIKIHGKIVPENIALEWLARKRELKLKVRLIDLMEGGKKPLLSEIWNFLPEDPFGGVLLGWSQVGVQDEAKGFYGLTLKSQWQLPEIDNYPALVGLYHRVRSLMGASPLFNVLDEVGFVKMNQKGEIGFGESFTGYTGKEIHELVLARLIALAISTLTMRGRTEKGKIGAFFGGELKSELFSKTRLAMLTTKDIGFLQRIILNPPFRAPQLLSSQMAQRELKERLASLGWE